MTKPITLITGSTSGIGKRIAIDLLDKGHYVIFMGRTDESSKKLINELDKTKYTNKDYCILFPFDMSDKDDVEKTIDIIVHRFSYIDNIIFNIGQTCRKNFNDVTAEEFGSVMNTNVIFPYYMITKLACMIKKRIIFIGSVLGRNPSSASIPYGVSKGSLEIMTKYLAKEFASKKITVNTLALGFTDTNWHASKPHEQIERIKNQILLKRFATKKEASHACQFIIENDYITGSTVCVDGGFRIE